MQYKCSVCGDMVDGDVVTYVEHTEKHIIEAIKVRHPEWAQKGGLCPKCVEYYKDQIRGSK